MIFQKSFLINKKEKMRKEWIEEAKTPRFSLLVFTLWTVFQGNFHRIKQTFPFLDRSLQQKQWKWQIRTRSKGLGRWLSICSCWGSEFALQHPNGGWKPSVSPTQGPSACFWPHEHCMHRTHKHKCRQNTQGHKIQQISQSFFFFKERGTRRMNT